MTVIWVALIGIAINTATALLFMSDASPTSTSRGLPAYGGRCGGVVRVVITALAIMATGWLWLDPAVSLVIAIVHNRRTWSLLRDSLNLALDAVPAHVDIARSIAILPGCRVSPTCTICTSGR